jgi:hypothetical protein
VYEDCSSELYRNPALANCQALHAYCCLLGSWRPPDLEVPLLWEKTLPGHLRICSTRLLVRGDSTRSLISDSVRFLLTSKTTHRQKSFQSAHQFVRCAEEGSQQADPHALRPTLGLASLQARQSVRAQSGECVSACSTFCERRAADDCLSVSWNVGVTFSRARRTKSASKQAGRQS